MCAHQNGDLQTFQKLTEGAVQYGMKKVLTCCEYRIAIDSSGTFNEAVQHLPPENIVHLIDCLRRMFLKKCYRTERWSSEDFLSADLKSPVQMKG